MSLPFLDPEEVASDREAYQADEVDDDDLWWGGSGEDYEWDRER